MSILPTQQSHGLGSQRLPRSQGPPGRSQRGRQAGVVALPKHSQGQFVPQPGSWLGSPAGLSLELDFSPMTLAEMWG